MSLGPRSGARVPGPGLGLLARGQVLAPWFGLGHWPIGFGLGVRGADPVGSCACAIDGLVVAPWERSLTGNGILGSLVLGVYRAPLLVAGAEV